MHRFARIATIAIPVLIASTNISAQTCMGRPAFSSAGMHLGAVGQIGNDLRVLGVDLSAGKARGLFGRVGGAHQTLTSVTQGNDPGGYVLSGAVGFQLHSNGRVQICPVVSVDWGWLDMGENVKLRRTQFQIGPMFALARPGAATGVVPFAGLAFAQLASDVEVEDIFGGGGTEETSLGTDTYFPLTMGVGWHKRAFALVGELTIPIDLGSTRPIVGIRAVFPLGARE